MIPCLHARSRDFERPDHAPRSPAGPDTCVVSTRGPLRAPQTRAPPEENVRLMSKKVSLIHRVHIQQSVQDSYIDIRVL